MKTFAVIALALVFALVLSAAVDAAHHEVHAEQTYCPRNERKSCHVTAQNREKFDFLLSCPASAPLYKLRGSYQGESQFGTTKNSAWHSSYLFTQNSEMLLNARVSGRQGHSLSPNMYGVTRTDRDVYLFESSFSNGVVDERQGACRSWHHQFAANKDVFLFDSGAGKPIIVAQDARWGSRRWGEGVQEIAPHFDYFPGHSSCAEADFDCSSNSVDAWHQRLENGIWDQWHDGYFSDSSYKYTGQWLYSVCADDECSSASTPRPFWGRDIGEPLHQNTLAELAFFPMAPDWAYNSPVLGATPSQVSTDGRGGQDSYFRAHDIQNVWAVGNSPGGIASTHVTNAAGESLLVLLMNGLPIANGGKPGDAFGVWPSPTGSYYLVWCQTTACETWGVREIEASRFGYGTEHEGVRSTGWANQRPSLSASGGRVYVMLHSRDDSEELLTISYDLVSLELDSEEPLSVSESYTRYTYFESIYANLIGVPVGPSSSEEGIGGYDWVDDAPELPYAGYGSQGNSQTHANHPLLAAPLRDGYGGSALHLFDSSNNAYRTAFDPTRVCVNLERYGIKSDPWCHWTTYLVERTSGVIQLDETETIDMGYDVVVPCNESPLYFTARRSPAQHEATNDYAAVMWTDAAGSRWYWPERIEDPDNEVQEHAGVNQSPYQMADMVLGRRFSAVRSANGQPFFTWADLGAGLGDGAVQTWGVCGFEGSARSVAPTCHTLLDSIELGTMGWLNGLAGKTLLLSAPDDELPVMVYYFDHFGGSGSYVEYMVDGFHAASGSVRGSPSGLNNQQIRNGNRRSPSGLVSNEFSDVSSRLRVPAPGQVTNRPLVVACLDALCEEASVSAFAPARMADIVNWWQGPYVTSLDVARSSQGTGDEYTYSNDQLDYEGVLGASISDLPKIPGTDRALLSAAIPSSSDALNVAEYALFSLRQVNPAIRADARFVGKQLYVVLNEGGYDDEFANNPIKVWRTNRWASPTGMPCSGGNAGERVVADDVVYICTRVRIGSSAAKIYAGSSARPWTRLYEWVKMDWGFGLRTLGGFLGWGSDEQRLLDLVSDKNPFYTHGVVDWLQHATAAQTEIIGPSDQFNAPGLNDDSNLLYPQQVYDNQDEPSTNGPVASPLDGPP